MRQIVFLKDVSHDTLTDLIQFMYCGEVNVQQDNLTSFMSTAEALKINGFTEKLDLKTASTSTSTTTSTSAPSIDLPSKETASDRVKTLQESRVAQQCEINRVSLSKLNSKDKDNCNDVVQTNRKRTFTPSSNAIQFIKRIKLLSQMHLNSADSQKSTPSATSSLQQKHTNQVIFG